MTPDEHYHAALAALTASRDGVTPLQFIERIEAYLDDGTYWLILHRDGHNIVPLNAMRHARTLIEEFPEIAAILIETYVDALVSALEAAWERHKNRLRPEINLWMLKNESEGNQ